VLVADTAVWVLGDIYAIRLEGNCSWAKSDPTEEDIELGFLAAAERSIGMKRWAPGSSSSSTRRNRAEAKGQLSLVYSGNGFFAVAIKRPGRAL
jgi:hypothetical protein